MLLSLVVSLFSRAIINLLPMAKLMFYIYRERLHCVIILKYWALFRIFLLGFGCALRVANSQPAALIFVNIR